jgi:hypothetical protein
MGTHASVGIIANPMAGRDVRRLVARATSMTPETKRDQVARAAIGAAAAGASRIFVCAEPFRISASAVENLDVGAEICVLDIGATLHAEDSARAAIAMRDAGCSALVVLGGDGTNRIVAKAWPDAPLVPLSTGTNNVFPVSIEATLAGAAVGLVASGRVSAEEVSRRAKVVSVDIESGDRDLALVDAVLLVDDRIGNLLPFDPKNIARVVLARAEPASVGTSPIGGLLMPSGFEDDFGVDVECTPTRAHAGEAAHDSHAKRLLVPVSPGLYREVDVKGVRRLELGEAVEVRGPGVLAFDGDRERTLADGQCARLSVVREGPRVLDVALALRLAAERGLFLDRKDWHDSLDDRADVGCC